MSKVLVLVHQIMKVKQANPIVTSNKQRTTKNFPKNCKKIKLSSLKHSVYLKAVCTICLEPKIFKKENIYAMKLLNVFKKFETIPNISHIIVVYSLGIFILVRYITKQKM